MDQEILVHKINIGQSHFILRIAYMVAIAL